MRNRLCLRLLIPAILLLPFAASAQLAGHNLLGDRGVRAGMYLPPGLYPGALYSYYYTDTVRNVPGGGTLDVNGIAPYLRFVSSWRPLGGTYSFLAALPLVSTSFEAPALGLDVKRGFNASDLYIQPINLSWQLGQTAEELPVCAGSGLCADAMASFGIFTPTGRYQVGADDNIGLGMWSFELAGGGTVYLTDDRSWHVATMAAWESHSEKEKSDVQVGQILTLEGGVGKSFLYTLGHFGVSYYAQWKLTHDDQGELAVRETRHRVFGVGPEIRVPLSALFALILPKDLAASFALTTLTASYHYEFGAKVYSEGDSFALNLSVPILSQ